MNVVAEVEHNRQDIRDVRHALAQITALVVQTIAETDPAFTDRLHTRMKAHYDNIRHASDEDVNSTLQLLSWVNELTGGNGYRDHEGDSYFDD